MSTKFKVNISGADISVGKDSITVKGKEGEATLQLKYPFIHITKTDNTLLIEAETDNGYQKAIAGTLAADIKNMLSGVSEKYTAELELVYMHFPASIKISNDKLIVENYYLILVYVAVNLDYIEYLH